MCSCQRTVAGLSFRGLQPGAIDSDKFILQVVLGFRASPPSPKAVRRAFFLSEREKMVGVRGVEPRTLRLSSACSNQLSYTPQKSDECRPSSDKPTESWWS